MKNQVLSKKIEDLRNSAAISNSYEEHHTSLDNISDEIIDKHIFDFLDDIDFDEETFAELIAEMKNTDVDSLLSGYYLIMNIPQEMFLDSAKIFYDSLIIEVLRMVNIWYYSSEFYMLAKNLCINTSDVIEMHKLQNRVVNNVWFCFLDYINTVIYGDVIEDLKQTKTCPNEIKNQIPDHILRFAILSFIFHASEYEHIFNNYRIEEDF